MWLLFGRKNSSCKAPRYYFDFIRNTYDDSIFKIRYDRTLPDQNCSRERPDILFKLFHRKLNSRVCREYIKQKHIAADVFLFRDSHKNQHVSLEERLEKLKEEIDY